MLQHEQAVGWKDGPESYSADGSRRSFSTQEGDQRAGSAEKARCSLHDRTDAIGQQISGEGMARTSLMGSLSRLVVDVSSGCNRSSVGALYDVYCSGHI
jgi:hypothetical protein